MSRKKFINGDNGDEGFGLPHQRWSPYVRETVTPREGRQQQLRRELAEYDRRIAALQAERAHLVELVQAHIQRMFANHADIVGENAEISRSPSPSSSGQEIMAPELEAIAYLHNMRRAEGRARHAGDVHPPADVASPAEPRNTP